MSTSRDGPLDIHLHQVDEVGAAGDELGRRVGRDWRDRIGDVVGARVGEVVHGSRPLRRSAADHLLDGRDDVGIGAAAADIAAHQLADLVGGRAPALRRSGRPRADLAGRAVAALEGVVLDERLLHRVELAACARGLRWS